MARVLGLFGTISIFISCVACSGQNAETSSEGGIEVAQKKSISQEMKAHSDLSTDERIALYRKLKKNKPEAYNFENEDELTMYGYSLLWANQVQDAIKIFQLIVDEFNSPNSYDSLGEAYLKNGNTVLALFNYKKALEMNPENFNAADQIALIEHPELPVLTASEKFAKVYSVDAYISDLDQLGRKLLEVHPNALKFIAEEAFWKIVEEKKALITPQTTYAEFVWFCDEIIASINCSHTSLGRFFQETEMLPVSKRFPAQVRWVDGKLCVIDPLNNGENLKVKDEILRINGIAVSELVEDIFRHISSQGYIETTKKQFFNTWATAMIPYALRFPETYSVTIRGAVEPIGLHQAETFADLYRDPSIKYCGDDLCFEILDGKTAVLTISSFNFYPWNNLSVFTDFIDRTMQEINQKGIKNLVMDLRFNGGGSQQSAIHLLRYLVDRPFTYYSRSDFPGKTEKIDGEEVINPFKNSFEGAQYFIIDGEGNSTTGHFMSLVKVLDLGTIVGEELGSNQFCSAGQAVCRLSNTKLVYYVANNTHISNATALPDETGILPDHYVTQDIDAYLEKKDVVKEYALNLIENKQ